MNDKDITEQFIRDVKSVDYFNKKIISINLKLEELSIIMQGVSSPSFTGVVIENGSNNYQHNLLENISNETNLSLERLGYVSRINEVAIIFDRLPLETKRIITECYLLNKRHGVVANDNGYARQYMYKKINKDIIKILKK